MEGQSSLSARSLYRRRKIVTQTGSGNDHSCTWGNFYTDIGARFVAQGSSFPCLSVNRTDCAL